MIGLALNIVGAANFLFAYPPQTNGERLPFIRLSRLALLQVFCGFVLQFVAARLSPLSHFEFGSNIIDEFVAKSPNGNVVTDFAPDCGHLASKTF